MTDTLLPQDTPTYRSVHVDLGPRAYDVLIGRGLLAHLETFFGLAGLGKSWAWVITDENVWPALTERELDLVLLEAMIGHNVIKITPGEARKSLPIATYLLSKLAGEKVPRSGTVIALGGGVIGDLAGFVAATYLRGINFVQIPTTLLAMVDSSVGGKTGVNLPEGKNLVGAFYQPKLVIADLDTLKTLPPKEFAAGMAEIIKHGAIADGALFDRVANGVRPEDADLAEIIEKCIAIKARIVEQDEFEEKGLRALLNFGHTIGHAIEKATGYQQYLHGEAVALGMRAAAWLSHWHAGLPEEDVVRLEKAIAANGLPLQLGAGVDSALIHGALGNDKKVASDGRNRWVLLPRMGEAVSGREIPGELVERAIALLYTAPTFSGGL